MIRIYGGSLATLVLAEQLVRREQRFEWFTLGERIGGHFAGLAFNGTQLDVGMVLLELEPGLNDPTEYARAAGEQGALEDFLTCDTVEASVKAYRDGEFVEDYLISDNTDAFRAETASFDVSTSDLMHPRAKWSDSNFEKFSYATICERLYPGFYKLFLEKIAEKITDGNASELSARYHRSAWLPLYYPESIVDPKSALMQYPFRRVHKISFASLIFDKINAVLNSKFSTVTQETQTTLSPKDLSAEAGVLKFFGCDMLKIPELSKVFISDYYFNPFLDFAVLEINSEAVEAGIPDCVFDVDDEFIFRVTFHKNSLARGNNTKVFIEARSNRKSNDDFTDYCTSYMKRRFNLSEAKILISRTRFLGPRMPKPGAEKNLSKMRDILLEQYSGEGKYFYGLFEGLNSMAMNKQVDHAINHWGLECQRQI